MSFEQKMSSVNAENENKKKKLKVTVIDESSNVESEALDIADSKMTESKDKLTGFRGMFKKIWKHNLAQPYYRRKEYEKARAEILERRKLYGNAEEQRAYEKSLVDQFSSEYDEAIHAEVGEKREKLGVTETEMQIKSEIKKLISDYIEEKVTDETFSAEQTRIFSQIKEAKKDVVDKGLLYSSNILEIAKQVKQSLAHGESLDNLDLDFDVIVGKAKSDVRTEAQYNTLDKIIDEIQKGKIGGFLNETTISAAVSIAYCSGSALLKKITGSKLAAWGSFGATAIFGSGFAAAREKKRLEDERKQHFREMAQGKKFEAGSKRREEMEQYRYETENATNLSDNLEYFLYNFNEKGERETKNLDQNGFQEAIGKLAEIESRIKISDRQRLDLISFSDKSRVVEERLRLDLLRATAKIDLEKMLAGSNGSLALPKGKTFSEFLNTVSETRVMEINGGDSGIEKKNELFRKMRNKKVWEAGVKGFLTGAAFGVAAQEIGALFQEGQEGFFEVSNAYAAEAQQAAPAVHSYTFLEGARRWISGDLPRMDASKIHEVLIGDNHIKLPEGADLIRNDDGTANLLRGEEVIGENIKFNPDGSLSDESKIMLTEKGIGIESDTVTSSPKDIVSDHEDLTTKIKRVLWYDNDTPKPVFDKNELRLHWGGKSGAGIDSDGNYVFNIKHMAPGGSYHGKFSVDAQEAMQNGKLKMLLSLSRDTQNQVFEVPIDAKGNAVIDPNSEIGKLFFQNEGGHAKFMGRFAEVAEIMGKKDGADMTRILSTLEGKGVGSSTDLLTKLDLPADYNIEPSPFVPIIGRRPLEKTKERQDYLGGGYFELDAQNKQYFRERRSEKLNNPNAELNHFEEIKKYFNRLPKERVAEIERLSNQIIEPMNSECKLSVCIPIAGHQEGKNIYKTLSEFKGQVDENGKKMDYEKFEVVAFVNHPKDTTPDNTMDEIRRFQKDNPDIKVRMIYKQLDRDKGEVAIGNIRKYATDIALFRHHQRGAEAKDLIIVSNDADCEGMSRKYVSNYIAKFDKNPHVDSMLGKIDWDPKAYVKSPSFYVGTRLFQFLDIIRRHDKNPKQKNVGSSGANFAFKSSMYAAVGGYIEADRKCEDVDLGNMIKYAREGGKVFKPISFAGDGSIVYTNARRGLDAMKKGYAPAEQWHGEFGADDVLRSMDWKIEDEGNIAELLDKKEYTEKLKHTVEVFVNRTLKAYGIKKDAANAKRALDFLGIKYVMKDDQVRVTDISKMIARLKNYQKSGLDIFKRKITKK